MTKPTISTNRKTRSYWRGYGARLRLARLTLGVSEGDAASSHRVTTRTYRAWESGARHRNDERDLDGVLAFARKYAVSLDWLFLGEASSLKHFPQLAKNRGGKIAILPVITREKRRAASR